MPGIKWIYLRRGEGTGSHSKNKQETWGFEKGQKSDLLRKTQTWVRKEPGPVSPCRSAGMDAHLPGTE